MTNKDNNLDHLSEEARRVTQEEATEAPFSGDLLKEERDGMYHCVVCDQPLFPSDTKFKSGSGWPSFYAAVDDGSITLQPDKSLATERTEVRCGSCGAHLGHVFADGPEPTGKRFCINSCSLQFSPDTK